jgi:hypothetical protein
MLHQKIQSEKYKAEVIKKLSNFCDKAPVLLSFVTQDDGVTLIHTNSGLRYFYPWDFTLPVKSFIYNIKQDLIKNHYPRLLQVVKEQVSLTPEEQAKLLEEGVEPGSLPSSKEVMREKLWRIDRVIVWKDIFILVDEETQEQYRYKMNKSCIFFLKNYRNGKYTLESAADYFFEHSELLNRIGDPPAQETTKQD